MGSPYTDDERTVVEHQLEMQRTDLVALLDGLSEDEARARLVPSLTTPMGLVLHATFVERVWFHHRVAGVPREQVGIPDTVEESFLPAPQDTVTEVRARYLQACEHSRKVAARHGLDDVFDWRGSPVSLRYIYAHLLTELARHLGHGDILIEQLRSHREMDAPTRS